MIKAIIFDYDDTLVTTLPTKLLALQKMAKNIYKFELTEAQIKLHWGKPYKELLRLLFMESKDDLDNIIINYEKIRDNYQASFYADVGKTLTQLAQNLPVGMLTAAPRNLIMKDLEMLQFPSDVFFYIQTVEDTSVHKPDPEVFRPILKKLLERSISAKEVVYVGDSLNDYIAAQGAGLDFYGIPDRTTSKETFEKNSVKIITSLKELLYFVRK